MSRPDNTPRVGVDFAPPRPANRTRPLLAVVAAVVLIAVAALAVTQLLLR